jgi:hypothetical protein
MKVSIKCNKNYGGNFFSIDASPVDSGLLLKLAKENTKDGVVNVTSELVDAYNTKAETISRFNNHKTAGCLANQIRKLYKQIETNKSDNAKSSVEIRLYDDKEGKCYYSRLTNKELQELEKIIDIEWEKL